MKTWKLPGLLLAGLASLALAGGVAVLDWLPTLKELGRLRRERSEWGRKAGDYRAAAVRFAFPDAGEEQILDGAEALLRRTLPALDDVGAWRAACVRSARRGAQMPEIAAALLLLGPGEKPFETVGTDADQSRSLSRWVEGQSAAIADGFALALAPARFPWSGLLAAGAPSPLRPAGRLAALAAAAPLPALLRFINRVSWDETRLEIVRLRLEPGQPLSRAWLVCRGSGLARAGPFALGPAAEELLVDLDSPLLLRRVEPLPDAAAGKLELPPEGSPW